MVRKNRNLKMTETRIEWKGAVGNPLYEIIIIVVTIIIISGVMGWFLYQSNTPPVIHHFTLTEPSGVQHVYTYRGRLVRGPTIWDSSNIAWRSPDGYRQSMHIPNGWIITER
jgi:hypothetical protein